MGPFLYIVLQPAFWLQDISWTAFHLPSFKRLWTIWNSHPETEHSLWAILAALRVPLMGYSHFQWPQRTRNFPQLKAIRTGYIYKASSLSSQTLTSCHFPHPPFSNFKLKFDVKLKMLPEAACRALRLKQWQHLPGETHRSFFGPRQRTAGIGARQGGRACAEKFKDHYILKSQPWQCLSILFGAYDYIPEGTFCVQIFQQLLMGETPDSVKRLRTPDPCSEADKHRADQQILSRDWAVFRRSEEKIQTDGLWKQKSPV